MKTILHKAESRGHYDYGWLSTKHTFSFARYNNPERINFGALRVLNEDIVKPGEGFSKHPHDNMEIVSIPLEGKLLHRDSMEHEDIIRTGEVQVMSAGTGIFHEEHNASKTNNVHFLQIWIYPNQMNVKPRYEQKRFNPDDALDQWQALVNGSGNTTLMINQNAKISRVFLSEGTEIKYDLSPKSHGSYLFNIYGSVKLLDITINDKDGVGILNTQSYTLKALKDSYLINLEVPNM